MTRARSDGASVAFTLPFATVAALLEEEEQPNRTNPIIPPAKMRQCKEVKGVRYVALGDPITAGELASSPNLAYPSRIVQNLQGATGVVLANPGWTSEALLSCPASRNSPGPSCSRLRRSAFGSAATT